MTSGYIKINKITLFVKYKYINEDEIECTTKIGNVFHASKDNVVKEEDLVHKLNQ